MIVKKILVLLFLKLFILLQFVHAQVDYEMTVAQDGSGDFTSIQEAINATKAFPDKPVVIHIKKGEYKEKVRVYSWNTKLTLRGEDRDETIITYNDYFDKIDLGRNSTFHTYTMKVEANDFTAENLTIINSSGPVGQAVALHVEGDRCQFRNCKIMGHQDTLFAAGEGSRQYYKNCFIEGTTDFIFGEGIAVFDSCTIHSLSDSYITAASTPQNESFGFVFLNCKLMAKEGVTKVSLGRPWRDYAKVVFLYSDLGRHIVPEGWSNWDGTNRDKTAYYAEYQNTGSGAKAEQRVNWSQQLSKKDAKAYTVKNILSGDDGWNPSRR